MRILYVNKFFDLHGGAEVYVHRLIKKQIAAGHEVHVFSTQSQKNQPSLDAARFVKRFDYSRSEGALRDAHKAVAFLWNREAKRAMTETLRDLRPDVIHLHNIYHHLSTSILAPIRQSRIPCVQTLHDYKLACPNYKMFTEGSVCERCKGRNYFESVVHQCLFPSTAANMLAAVEMGMTKLAQSYERTVKIFIAPSQFLADKMVAWGEPSSKFEVIPNPVDIPEVSASRDGNFLLAVGRLSIEKGFDTLIRAAARVPDVRIKIAGIGPEESRLKQLVKTLNAKNIEFVGFLRHDDLGEMRRRAMGLVVPSVWYENAPLAVLEALADGLPVIASRIGGLPELVEDGNNGFLFDAQSPEALAIAMKRFVTGDGCNPSAMAASSRHRAKERYTWSMHMAALEALYCRVQR